MELSTDLMRARLAEQVGQRVTVLVDRAAAVGPALGRIWSQAPEVDGLVLLKGAASPGDLVEARVTGVRDVDLEAEIV